MHVKSLQSCAILFDPMDCSLPGFSVHGIFQARVPEWVAFSFSRGSSWSRNQIGVSCIAGGFFTTLATREAPLSIGIHISPPFWTSLLSPSPSYPYRLIQSPCLSFLSHTANSHWLSILHMVMFVSTLLFPYISPSPPLSPCLQVYSLCLFLHYCPVNKFFSTIFLDSVCLLT